MLLILTQCGRQDRVLGAGRLRVPIMRQSGAFRISAWCLAIMPVSLFIFCLQNRRCSVQLKPQTNFAGNFQKTALSGNEMSEAIRPVLHIPFAKISNP
ncbi:hypothetical protein [Collimonas sp. OK412]|jgi:hypothetical protein|uniref:hypothetical protein n=1 Tax=Collimonas sp. (strain OK412) TaxID=1801619 RepID=UPI00111397A4|nr:hypothetical protein [Collimonas sp. OK412]